MHSYSKATGGEDGTYMLLQVHTSCNVYIDIILKHKLYFCRNILNGGREG